MTIRHSTGHTIDTLLLMEDGAAAITADGAGSDILDLGDSVMQGDLVIEVSAFDLTTLDEFATINFQVADSATFASTDGVSPVQFTLGNTVEAGAQADTSALGRYIVPVTNEYRGEPLRYARLWVNVGGTSPSITFKAWLAKRH